MSKEREILFLSGAPRVSTSPESAISGARSRIHGIKNGFESHGFAFHSFIFGDRIRRKLTAADYDGSFRRSLPLRLAADAARVFLALKNGIYIFFKYRGHKVCYERLGLMQFLGWFLQKRGAFWILESHALLFQEGRLARNATFFWRLARFLERKAYRKADLIVTVSGDAGREIAAFAKVSPQKIVVVPNGVDPELFRVQETFPRRLLPHPVIGFTGVMYEWQGLEMLIRAVKELREEGIAFNLVLVGDGVEMKKLQELSRELGIADGVVFTGRVPPDQVPALIAGMDLCYSGQVSRTGGEASRSPIKAYEYMAMKKPLLSADFEDARKVVRDGYNGFLFDSADHESFKNTLRRAYRLRDSWPELGANGRQDVLLYFTWQKRFREVVERIEAR